MTLRHSWKKYIWSSVAIHGLLLATIFISFTFKTGIQKNNPVFLPGYLYSPSAQSIQTTNSIKSSSQQHVQSPLGIIKQRHSAAHKNLTAALKRAGQSSDHQINKDANESFILKILHTAIAEKQTYPESALELKQTGTVTIGFLLYPNGDLTQLSIQKTSGVAAIDSAALAAVSAISPVKSVSDYLQKAKYFSVDVIFA